jgi:cell division protein FtsB
VTVWTGLYRLALGMLAVALAAVLVFMFLPKYGRLRELQREKDGLEDGNRALEEQIRDLQDKRERFTSDPAFVERTAREAGMVKPDETVYKFVPANQGP